MNEDIISIGANCIVRIRNRFFLLVEIEVEFGNVAIEEFVFIRISEQDVFCKIKVQSIAAKFPACNFTWRRGHDSLSRHASY
ncbi:hypothetical protein [Bacillus cereus]|uniref:hypothetical protein n=1 Tax=Bacillus cereus TaxID=1396 RepID=UPI003012EE41